MKNVFLGLGAALLISNVAYAAEDDMSKAAFLTEARNDAKLAEQINAQVALFDINSDGKISYNEIVKAREGIDIVPDEIFQADNKKAMSSFMVDAFYQSDLSGDGALSGDEIKAYAEKLKMFTMEKKFEEMDKNHDGVLNMIDMPSEEEAMQQMDEAIKRMQESVAKMEQIDPEVFANNFVESARAAVAEEDYNEMDADKNSCVTMDEYAAYRMARDAEDDDPLAKMSKMDYYRWFLMIPAANRNCMTKDEYVAYEGKPVDAQIEDANNSDGEKIFAGLLFEEMDADKNGKLSADEFVTYQLANEARMTAEDAEEQFQSEKGADKGFVTKEDLCAEDTELCRQDKLFCKDEAEINLCYQTFSDMDKNGDQRLSKQEYVDYFVIDDAEMARRERMAFESVDGAEKGWISKEEFVESYLE